MMVLMVKSSVGDGGYGDAGFEMQRHKRGGGSWGRLKRREKIKGRWDGHVR